MGAPVRERPDASTDPVSRNSSKLADNSEAGVAPDRRPAFHAPDNRRHPSDLDELSPISSPRAAFRRNGGPTRPTSPSDCGTSTVMAGPGHCRGSGTASALLNESHGTANTESSGYHETITRAQVALPRRLPGESGPSGSAGGALRAAAGQPAGRSKHSPALLLTSAVDVQSGPGGLGRAGRGGEFAPRARRGGGAAGLWDAMSSRTFLALLAAGIASVLPGLGAGQGRLPRSPRRRPIS